jgi:hypothetical protein
VKNWHDQCRKPRASKRRFICVGLLGLATALVGITFLQYNRAQANVLGGPLPAPPLPPDNVQLSPVEKLGELMLYDSSLSNPPGYSCATCHVPETGFTGPIRKLVRFPVRSRESYLEGLVIANLRATCTPHSVPLVHTTIPVSLEARESHGCEADCIEQQIPM